MRNPECYRCGAFETEDYFIYMDHMSPSMFKVYLCEECHKLYRCVIVQKRMDEIKKQRQKNENDNSNKQA